jgi:hypothetical protein
MPDIGVFIDVSVLAERWFAPNAPPLKLDCGRFWIDTVDCEFPEQTVTIKGSSLPTAIRIKSVTETRNWQSNNLKNIAQQICDENPPLKLRWEAKTNPRYVATEQTEESALQFLKKRAEDAKIAIKAHKGELIFFDEQDYEARPAVFTLLYGSAQASDAGLPAFHLAEAHFSINLVDGLKGATVKSVDMGDGKIKEGTWKPDQLLPPGPATIPPPEAVPPSGISGGGNVPAGGRGAGTVSQSEIDDAAAAERDDNLNYNPGDDDTDSEGGDGGGLREDPGSGLLVWNPPDADSNISLKAKAHVRKRNKRIKEGEVTMAIGNPLIVAGSCCNLNGFGQYDGKWFIQSVTHSIGPSYKTKMKIRLCLNGY